MKGHTAKQLPILLFATKRYGFNEVTLQAVQLYELIKQLWQEESQDAHIPALMTSGEGH